MNTKTKLVIGSKPKRPISEHAAVATEIRKDLKRNGIKASVRSECYSGGSSVRVEILEDVLPATYQAIRKHCHQYEYGHFDGMTDMYEYSNSRDDIPQVKFLFVNLHYSDELRQQAMDYLCERHADFEQWQGLKLSDPQVTGQYQITEGITRVLAGDFMPEFWTARKPRIAGYLANDYRYIIA